MRSALIGCCLLLLVAPLALAEDTLMLRSGRTAEIKLISTTADSVTFETVGEGTLKATIRASELDPYCFYRLRAKQMKPTAANHLALARWCLDNDLVTQAKLQADRARKLDPEGTAKHLSDKAVRDRIAGKLLDYARRQIERGKFDEAERWLDHVAERFGDTHGEAVRAAMAKLHAVQERRIEARDAERERKLNAIEDKAERAKALDRLRRLESLRLLIARASRQFSASVVLRGTQAKRGFEEAARTAQQGLAEAKKLKADSVDPDQLEEIIGELKRIAIKSYLHAARAVLARQSYVEAEKFARQALGVDPDHKGATEFLTHIALIRALDKQGVRVPRRAD